MLMFDKNSIKKLLERDEATFNQFYLKTVDIFYRSLKGSFKIPESDIHDILADYYLKVWKNLKYYDTKYKFETRIWVVFKNYVKDYFKKKKITYFGDFKTTENNLSIEDTIADEKDIKKFLQIDFEYKEIKKIISNLDQVSQEIIHLKFIEEYSNKEISKILNISYDNVRQRISRVINKIKKEKIQKI
jgi:RNA polymerase sigma-70 factor (ECF subfamily)